MAKSTKKRRQIRHDPLIARATEDSEAHQAAEDEAAGQTGPPGVGAGAAGVASAAAAGARACLRRAGPAVVRRDEPADG